MQQVLAEASDLLQPIPKIHRLQLARLKRVLIVEDDHSLLDLLTQVIEDISPGAEIDCTSSGEEAEHYLKLRCDSQNTPYDLIVADIFLDGEVTGLDIWKLCSESYPEANVIVTSSLPRERFLSALRNEVYCPSYLLKPFTMKECRDTFTELLT